MTTLMKVAQPKKMGFLSRCKSAVSAKVSATVSKCKQVVTGKAKQAFIVGGVTALTSMNAMAAEVDTIGASLNEELGAVKALVIGLFSLGAVLLGLFAGYKYLKRGANSA